MSTLTETLVLPAPYDQAELGAWTEYGKRKVSLTLKEPGTLYRNAYVMAWLDVTEQRPWTGEPLYLSGTRRPTDDHNWQRANFTEAARKAMAAELLPLIARYGFERWWLEVHRKKGLDAAAEGRGLAEEAAKVGRWHTAHAELGEMYADGALDVVALPPTPLGERSISVAHVDYDRRWSRATPAARLMLGGEQVGWLMTDSKILPLWNEPW